MKRRSTRPTVILFDVDGTLVTTGGAGRRAMERAFERIHGRADAIDGLNLGGMTDRAIVRQGLRRIGVDDHEATIDAFLPRYLEVLADEMATATGCRALPGVEAAVDAALSCEGIAAGLGTGNLEAGARLKLERVGLADRFPFGGFGCDHEVRDVLIRVGAERGAALLGAPFTDCRVVVVGDTPKDVAAARAIGAECVAVATGSFAVEALREAGAHHAVRDLAEDGALDRILGVD
jgi:phosphoglycolate phosphatase